MRRIAVVLACLAALAGSALGSTRRVAVVVGNNAGDGLRPALHYAEQDAQKFAEVLAELGGVAHEDLFLLQGKTRAELEIALAHARRCIAVFRKDPASRIVMMFYFSGHSDGEALELGHDRLSFTDLRRWLATTGADIRVALIDSCKSGALLAVKGGTPGPAFQIRLTDDVASTGEALLTSSAADEVALESREIGGSFFTHHFVSGLRGAADASGDGTVTLNEAYHYAYAHTLQTTGETLIGPQHPAYDYRLSGQGELVLSSLARPTAAIALPRGFERILVTDRTRDEVVAEIGPDAKGMLAVQPGTYAIRAWRAARIYATNVKVAVGEERVVKPEELEPAGAVSTASKGDDGFRPPFDAGPSVFIAGGGASGIAADAGIVPAVRVEARLPVGFTVAAIAGTVRAENFGVAFRETDVLLLAGYRHAFTLEPFRLWVGGELGAGMVEQSGITAAPAQYSSAFEFDAVAGASLAITDHIGVALEPVLGGLVVRRDGKPAVHLEPSVWFGLVVAF